MSIPRLSTPQSILGLRFATIIMCFPSKSSGEYHWAIPETIVRGVSVPSFKVSSKSFFALLTGLQSITSAMRSSTFAKSSNSICLRPTISFFASSFFSSFTSSFGSDSSISLRVFSASSREKSGTKARALNCPPEVTRARILSLVSGINGFKRTAIKRMLSRRL